MPLELVTKLDAYEQLRIDTYEVGGELVSDDDRWLDIWIPGVSEVIMDWLKEEYRAYRLAVDVNGNVVIGEDGNPVVYLDAEGNPVLKWSVKAAALIELDYQYRHRDGDGEHMATGDLYSGRYGYTLSKGATALLSSIRKTTVA